MMGGVKQSFRQCKLPRLPIVLGVAHGLADATTGFMLGSLPHIVSLDQVTWLILLYNGLAFGCQPLLGMIADRVQRPRLMVWLGLLCLSLSVMLVPFRGYEAIALAGVGSAAFHVGGGALSYWATPEQATGTSVFVALGVVGLALGGVLGFERYDITAELVGLLVGLAIAIAVTRLPELPYGSPSGVSVQAQSSISDESKETLLLMLIVAIALGSSVWTGLQLWLLGQTGLVLGMAIAAAVGKIVGGYWSGRLGWRRWTVTALLLAALLLVAGGDHPVTLLLGVACLQSVVPVTLAATIRLMPGHPATAAGLALGVAILVGGIPVLGGVTLFPQAIALVIVVLAAAAITLWMGLNPAAFAIPLPLVTSPSVSLEADAKQS
ncbi:MAG: hypothetical protein SFY66_14700 [Oculatellaceae cyanobacterium bins.114]|nr:hypothetical protein [Oculatellaceae cyanobacterium bins.114]